MSATPTPDVEQVEWCEQADQVRRRRLLALLFDPPTDDADEPNE